MNMQRPIEEMKYTQPFVALLILLVLAPGVTALERMNVLFILTEDQGQHLSYLATPGIQTPNMDRIARGGVYFSNAYVSYPVCSASKAALFTGFDGCYTGLVENTQNYFVPAHQLTKPQQQNALYRRVQIAKHIPTLIEVLDQQGYHLAISGKLHVAPNEKFPYDEWFRSETRQRVMEMIQNSKDADKPFFYLCNVQAPHRPYRNSDRVEIGVDPQEVSLPAFLPDTPVIRQDWAEYLDYCEVADQRIGVVLKALEQSGVMRQTLVVFMGDHGPAYHRGKMSLYQFGLNVPLALMGPGIPEGVRSDALFSGVDMMPTLLALLGLDAPETEGQSLAALVRGEASASQRKYAFAMIAHQGQQRDDGMQERSVFDGRWKLIYRDSGSKPRTVNSDLKCWELILKDGRKIGWRNRVYDEILRRKSEFPKAFQYLKEIDNGTYGTILPKYELYDIDADPDEFTNLAEDPRYQTELRRLKSALREWVARTDGRFLRADEID